MDKIILNDERVENNPVDESDEERHCGCAGLKAPGEGVKRREGVGKTGAGSESPSQHDPSIDEIMEGEKANTCRPGGVRFTSEGSPTLVCHVYKPFHPQCVQGGDEVESDPRGHEERQADPVDDVPGGGDAVSVPLAAVEKGNIGVDQPEFLLK